MPRARRYAIMLRYAPFRFSPDADVASTAAMMLSFMRTHITRCRATPCRARYAYYAYAMRRATWQRRVDLLDDCCSMLLDVTPPARHYALRWRLMPHTPCGYAHVADGYCVLILLPMLNMLREMRLRQLRYAIMRYYDTLLIALRYAMPASRDALLMLIRVDTMIARAPDDAVLARERTRADERTHSRYVSDVRAIYAAVVAAPLSPRRSQEPRLQMAMLCAFMRAR